MRMKPPPPSGALSRETAARPEWEQVRARQAAVRARAEAAAVQAAAVPAAPLAPVVVPASRPVAAPVPAVDRGPGDDTPDLVDLTPAEIRRFLAAEPPHHPARCNHTLTWSRWRRRHQACARQSHYERRAYLSGCVGRTATPREPGSPLTLDRSSAIHWARAVRVVSTLLVM